MKAYTVIVAAILMASLAIDNAKAHYDELEKYLVANVNTDAVEPNLEAAAKLLKAQKNKFSSQQVVPNGDLADFTSMQHAVDGTNCDFEAKQSLQINRVALAMYGFSSPVRRVEKVFDEILTNHAIKCLEVYPKIFSEKKQEIGETVFKRVEEMVGAIIKEDLLSPGNRRFHTEIEPYGLLDHYAITVNPLDIRKFVGLRSALRPRLAKKLFSGGRNGEPQLSGKNRIKELVEEYVMTPCWIYESEVGKDLFIPAEFDAKVYNKLEDDMKDFYLGWSYYKICRAILANKSVVYDAAIGLD